MPTLSEKFFHSWLALFLLSAPLGLVACRKDPPSQTPPEESPTVSKPVILAKPPEIVDPSWMNERKEAQLGTLSQFKVFHDFRFADELERSGISFVHRIVNDSGRSYIANHYDHGNAVAVADVDRDGLLDIYFTTQLGSNQLWHNQGNGRFEDWTERAGVAVSDRISVAASFADTDNDGDADLYVTTVRGGNLFFENDGTGKFLDKSADSGLDYTGHSSGVVFFDYDRDGLVDLFLTNVGQYTSDDLGPGGYYVGYKAAFGNHLFAHFAEQSILFKNQGGNHFVDVSEAVNLVDSSWSGDASPLDLNEDGWMDLYITNMQGHDEYYENEGGKRFVRKSREIFPATSWGAMGIGVLDHNNDGRMDIYITDMHTDMWDKTPFKQYVPELEKAKLAEAKRMGKQYLATDGNHVWGNAFFQNNGDGTFAEVSDQLNVENYWPWGLSVGDLNADGFEDLFVTASMNFGFRYAVNSVLLNNQGQGFLDSEFIVGVEPRRNGRTAIPWFTLDCEDEDQRHGLCEGHAGKVEVWGALGSRSSVIADIDNDGDLDIITNEFNSEPMVLVSNLSEKQSLSYLKIQLVGKKSNRDGLGAKVIVTTKSQTLTKYYDGKSGYIAQSQFPLYFGLGAEESVGPIEIMWPSGIKQTIPGPIQANQLLRIEEE